MCQDLYREKFKKNRIFPLGVFLNIITMNKKMKYLKILPTEISDFSLTFLCTNPGSLRLASNILGREIHTILEALYLEEC